MLRRECVPAVESDQMPAVEPDGIGTEVWAVCCSGGGIRSASYCLGALQSLQESGLLAKAK